MYEPKLFKVPPPNAKDGASPYVFNDEILVAVDVALASRRPLLVTGQPGVGKSTLARAIASGLDCRFLSMTVTSRTRLENLQADVDSLQRLADAQIASKTGKMPPDWAYLRPGVLWWAFNRKTAALRGATAADVQQAADLAPAALIDPSQGNSGNEDVVVLLDEIDKADPDLPNDLLEPLDRRRFSLTLADRPAVEAPENLNVLLVMTSNGERELPPAFLRRCVVLEIPEPLSRAAKTGTVTLEDIAESHFPSPTKAFSKLIGEVADEVDALRREAPAAGRRAPSVAEYLDTLRALQKITNLRERKEVWSIAKKVLLRK